MKLRVHFQTGSLPPVVSSPVFKRANIIAGLAYTGTAISPHSWPSKHRLRVHRRGRIVPYPAFI
jgi:hypothetical protein